MTREIKFRAWDKYNHLMIENFQEDKFFGERLNDDFYVVMQYTGLKDKNGKEIYESNKVRILYTDWSSQHFASEELQKLTLDDYKKAISDNGVIVWRGDRWQVEFDGRFGKEYGSIFPGTHGEIEVTGNLYENPELLNNKN